MEENTQVTAPDSTPADAPASAPADTPASSVVNNMLQSGLSKDDLKQAFKSALTELESDKSIALNREEIEKAEKEYFGGFLHE